MVMASGALASADDTNSTPNRSVDPSAAPSSPDASDTAAAIGAPRRFQTADFPAEAPLGSVLNDVISGGPGYIAVGGGSWRPRDYTAVVWTSQDGISWQSAELDEDAVSGAMEAVAALPGGGYVAVGRDSEPQGRTADDPPNALVWLSDDGGSWTLVPPHESFAEAIMYDVATTADGVIAVGCEATSASECSSGRAWTSTDGIDWALADASPILPFTVSANGGTVASGGTSDQSSPTNGRAVVAVRDGEGWSASDPLDRRQSQIVGSSSMGDGFAMAGYRLDPDGAFPRATIFVSPDGDTWDRVTAPRFRRMLLQGLATSGDLALITGIRPSGDIGYPPVALWSRDMKRFRESRFPDDVSGAGLELVQPMISGDGSMAIVVGAYEQRPWIWYSQLE